MKIYLRTSAEFGAGMTTAAVWVSTYVSQASHFTIKETVYMCLQSI